MNDRFGKLKKYNLWGGNTPSLGFVAPDILMKYMRTKATGSSKSLQANGGALSMFKHGDMKL
ncbi:MAG: hypothetical protein LBU37_06130 [Tannerellaceae bacterium]|nr:hypothetical protein [Tannerellaceae bacterium]